MTGYDTNLASEFYVLSMLHRLGASAALTLGNKKAVDIIVERGQNSRITLDVKGLASSTSWPVDNVNEKRDDHFLVFVCYHGKIQMVDVLPEVWIIPSTQLDELVHPVPSGRRVVLRATLMKEGAHYKDAWDLIVLAPDTKDDDTA